MVDESLRGVFLNVGRLHFIRMHALLKETGLYPGQAPLFLALFHKDGLSQKELVDILKVKPSTITVTVSRMEKSGLVYRKQDEKDQRVTRIFLTEKGMNLCQKVEDINTQLEGEAFVTFTIEEKVLLRRLLMQVRDNLQQACENDKELDMEFCQEIHSRHKGKEDEE